MGGESNECLSHLFEEPEFGDPNHLGGAASTDELYSILDTLDSSPGFDLPTPLHEATALTNHEIGAQKVFKTETEVEAEASYTRKKQKLSAELSMEEAVTNNPDGQQRIFHITVERNRRKQMNEHLYVLRSLVPAFHLKRGDQASIIGGVVDYITELQQILQSLEAKKQRKVYNEVLSPRHLIPLPLSPRLNLPISPRTPEPGCSYMPNTQRGYLATTAMATTPPEASASASASTFSSSHDNVNELAANSKSTIAEVDVKVSGPNVVLKTISARIPGQAVKIVAALEELALEILHVNISTTDDTMLNSFTIKIGIECELSAEELANEIQRTFSMF